MLLHSPTHICFISTKYLGSRRRCGGGKIKGKGRRAEEGLGGKGLREEEEGRGKQSAGEMGR